MQPSPGAAWSRLPIVVISVAIVLALVGIGGIASGAADKPSKHTAATGSTSTTVDVSGFGTDTSTSLTTLPGVAGTTTTVAGTGTTLKPTGTTAPTATGDCPVAPASASDPGAQQAPALGTYTYVSCTNATDTTDVKVAAGQSSNGVTRRNITEESGGVSQTATESWGPNGVLQEVLTINYGQQPIQCDWNPDVLLFPAQLSVGKTWNADSKCTIATSQLHLTASAKVSGRVTANVGGTNVNCWLVDADIKLQTPNGMVEVIESDYYDPVHGINVYRHSTSNSAQGKVERVDHLKTLTPKAS